MLDKSGRELRTGDLVIAFKNKQRLENMEYAIVVADGKVFNGTGTYTVGDNSYLCALTPKEKEIQQKLYTNYFDKSAKQTQRRILAKEFNQIGQVAKVNDIYYVYIGRVSGKYSDDGSNIFKNDKLQYAYLKFYKGGLKDRDKSAFNDFISNKVCDFKVIYPLIRNIKNYSEYSGFNSYDYGIDIICYSSKVSAIDELCGNVQIFNFDVGNTYQFVYNYGKHYSIDITREK